MKKLYSIFLLGMCTLSLSAQKENSTECHKRDHFNPHATKSATLSVAQITESEKYDVHFYSLDISMNNLVTDVTGTAEIHATASVPLDSALFELFQTLTITEIRLNGTPVSFNRNISAVKVPVNVNSGESFVLAIDYNGTPPTSVTNPLGGAGMSNESSPSWGNQVTWSLSQPFSAYEWWPCKQSLSDKADSCAIKVTVPNACKAGSNGMLENVIDLGNGTTRYEWFHQNPIDYYLISVAVAEYVEYNVYANPAGSPAPILVQNFVYNNPATLPNFQDEIDETADFIELFSDLYGLYPFYDEKYGHCMAPISGGMEHQTMTTQGYFEKGLTAHELGHQWFGDNVTCASWADIWVNEGFASYSEYLMLENIYPAERAAHMSDIHTNVMTQPGGSVWVLDSLNENRIFSGRLTYDKGAAIIHTMRFKLNNDSLFFQALKNFQTNFADSVAKGLDIKTELENVSGLDITNLFNEWYFGEGFPTYSARWNSMGTDLVLEITHTASKPATTPTFTNPLEVRFSRSGQADTIIRFDVNSNLEQYFVQNVGIVTNLVSIDPNNWIINQMGSKIKDVNFVAYAGLGAVKNIDIEFHPNPTKEFVQISIPNELTNVSLTITDQAGHILEKRPMTLINEIDLRNYSDGIYFFNLESNGTVIKTERIVKTR